MTLQDASIGAKGETLVVRANGVKELQVPILNLESVIVFGYKGLVQMRCNFAWITMSLLYF
ncbi:hypothetical protein BFO01nite_16640 [Brevibacillus formosus]|uniref:Uncharacterized protein n=1 Tax=Brevibacillus formosus TaxID=54913 RepID=A0ABQ0T3U7_9BACL|nr:hypothetical protein BFO01nite_16640 [Brevibacillus formosus]